MSAANAASMVLDPPSFGDEQGSGRRAADAQRKRNLCATQSSQISVGNNTGRGAAARMQVPLALALPRDQRHRLLRGRRRVSSLAVAVEVHLQLSGACRAPAATVELSA